MSHVVMMHSSPLTHAFVYSQWAISMIQNDAPTSPPRSLAAFVAAESVRSLSFETPSPSVSPRMRSSDCSPPRSRLPAWAQT